MLVKKEQKKNRFMSIDPSINNLGMAIWDTPTKHLLLWKLVHPKPDRRKNEFEKSVSMCDQLRAWAKEYQVDTVLMEVPEHWAVGGFEARETGSIAKLCFVCGLIYGMQYEMEKFELVVPRGWKGQLPKAVVANRLKSTYVEYGIDMTELNENVMDAIGIGHFKLFGGV